MPAADDLAWLAERLRVYLDHAPEGVTLDRALGVACRPGERPWWEGEALQRRDEHLREAAARLAVPAEQKATRLAAEIKRYACAVWPREKALVDPPERSRGTVRESLWRAFKVVDGRVPETPRRLRDLLALGK